jgi:DNA-binding Lrp family transcriptional regulator
MDIVDKKILYFLLKDGRIPQRQIARAIGISAQTLNYRMSKMMEDGIIKGFVVHVSPALYGNVEGYAAFVSDKFIEEGYFVKLSCLEKITLYGFEGKDLKEVEAKILTTSKQLGNPVMKYLPKLDSYLSNSKAIDAQLIDQLRKMPRSKIAEIAKILDLPVIRVKRRYNFLRKGSMIGVIAKIDLSRTDLVLFSIFSSQVEKIEPILENGTIFKISDKKAGVFVCFAENMASAKTIINVVRETEKESEVMVLYQYDFIN